MLIPKGTLILVLDGASSRLLRNDGMADAPRLVLMEESVQRVPRAHEMTSDAPGRSLESMGTVRHAYPAPDLHERQENEFARDAMRGLLDQAKGGEGVILIAPPDLLGEVRACWTGRETVLAEIDKDLTHLSARELEQYLHHRAW